MESADEFKNSAFRRVNTTERSKKNFEEVIDGSLSINEESMTCEIGGIIEREFVGETRENSALKMLTVNICQTYKKCKNDFDFEETMKPRRELTIPSEGVYNEGRDNSEFNLIVCVNDEIQGPNHTYIIIDLIGQGISGQVFKVCRKEDEKFFAMKIIKNKKAYKNQALIELRILEFLNNEVDKQDLHHIIRLFDHFISKEHLCIVFELLNENLFELLKQNYFQGISLNSIRFIIKQILEAVYQLQKANLIHCDLKPENVLLKIDKDNNRNDIIIKITDFGSSCFKNHTMFQYIQSRYYRAPEVLIGAMYSSEIDMWSIGCIAAELYLGEPILPGSCEFDQLSKITKLIGELPMSMIREGKNARKYYTVDQQTRQYRIKTVEEYYKEFPNDMEPKYEIPLDLKNLDELVVKSNKKHNANASLNSSANAEIINNDLESFVNFLKGLLQVDPKTRWNAKQALRHPFITKERFDGYFNPNAEEVSQFFYNSIDASHLSDYYMHYGNHHHRMNPNMYHSMIVNTNPYMSPSNMSMNNSMMSNNTNSSLDMSCYQYNMKNIPLHVLKNFPYAKIDQINLMAGTDKKGNKAHHGGQFNKFDQGMNNTFMKTSYDEIQFNNSFTSDQNNYNFYNQKKRKVKDDMVSKDKNKYTKVAAMLRQGGINLNPGGGGFNNQNNLGNNYCNNQRDQRGQNIGLMVNGFPYNNYNRNNDKRNSNESINKSLFSKMNNYNPKEYEGLTSQNKDINNRSFDFHNRARSKSDYYNQAYFMTNLGKYGYNTNNNLNFSNFSTVHNEKENYYKNYPGKNLSSTETPVVINNKLYPKTEEKECYLSTHEIREEDQGDQNEDEFILNFN